MAVDVGIQYFICVLDVMAVLEAAGSVPSVVEAGVCIWFTEGISMGMVEWTAEAGQQQASYTDTSGC
jgi:hypothetical protein